MEGSRGESVLNICMSIAETHVWPIMRAVVSARAEESVELARLRQDWIWKSNFKWKRIRFSRRVKGSIGYGLELCTREALWPILAIITFTHLYMLITGLVRRPADGFGSLRSISRRSDIDILR